VGPEGKIRFGKTISLTDLSDHSYALNVPLRDGITDDGYREIFESVRPVSTRRIKRAQTDNISFSDGRAVGRVVQAHRYRVAVRSRFVGWRQAWLFQSVTKGCVEIRLFDIVSVVTEQPEPTHCPD